MYMAIRKYFVAIFLRKRNLNLAIKFISITNKITFYYHGSKKFAYTRSSLCSNYTIFDTQRWKFNSPILLNIWNRGRLGIYKKRWHFYFNIRLASQRKTSKWQDRGFWNLFHRKWCCNRESVKSVAIFYFQIYFTLSHTRYNMLLKIRHK